MPGSNSKATDNPTATSTTSIIVPQAPPQQQHLYDGWGVANLIWMGIAGLLTAATLLIGFVKGISELWEKMSSKSKSRLIPLETRLTSLEDLTKKFRATEQLDKENGQINETIQHMKRGLQFQIDGLADRMRSAETNHNDMKLAYTKLEGKVEGLIDQQTRHGKALDRLEEKMDEGFKSLTGLILNRPDNH